MAWNRAPLVPNHHGRLVCAIREGPKTPSGVHHGQIIPDCLLRSQEPSIIEIPFSFPRFKYVLDKILLGQPKLRLLFLHLSRNPSGRMVPASTVWWHLYFPHSGCLFSEPSFPLFPGAPLPKHDLGHPGRLRCTTRLLNTFNPNRKCRVLSLCPVRNRPPDGPRPSTGFEIQGDKAKEASTKLAMQDHKRHWTTLSASL